MFSQTATVAPLAAADIEACLRPLGEARMLPAKAYADDQVFAWDQQRFFEEGWVCAGRSADIAEPGMQRAESIGKTGVLITRDKDGRLHAFANVCRHRGHELLPCGSSTKKRAVVCPYHAWSYDLDGSLKVAPGFRGVEAFDPGEFGLSELLIEEWHGWIFVNPSGTAGPLEDHLGDLGEVVGTYQPQCLQVRASHNYVVRANWKTITENYHECYHCPLIHPELCKVSPPDSGDNFNLPGAWVGGWMDLRDGMDTMSLDGASGAERFPWLPQEWHRRVIYIGLLPNLLISLHPDYVMTHRMTPIDARSTAVECAWAFAPEVAEREGFDPSYAVDFWDITNRQDWAACESVQRGMDSGRYIPGPLSPDEDAVHRFIAMVARGYAGLPIPNGS
jgi:Rieske 2Fe-2S family protein